MAGEYQSLLGNGNSNVGTTPGQDDGSGMSGGGMSGMGGGIGGAVGLLGNAFSTYQTYKLNKKKQDLLNTRRNELSNWFNTNYNKNILDTDYGKAMNTQLEKSVNDTNKNIANRQAITGGTDEAVAAQKQGEQQMIGNTYNNIAAKGYGMKEGIRQEALSRQGGLDAGQNNLYDAQAKNWENFSKNLTSSVNSMTPSFSDAAKVAAV